MFRTMPLSFWRALHEEQERRRKEFAANITPIGWKLLQEAPTASELGMIYQTYAPYRSAA